MSAPAASDKTDIVASLVLIAATVAALVVANSPLAGAYKAALAYPISVGAGGFEIAGPVKVWIKDALMAIFFLQVGLEIKAEFKEGALSDRQRAILPFVAAAGGMAVPALIYSLIVGGNPAFMAGWAIPSATDIAFAVGVVGLMGAGAVPLGLKAFLLAVAVIDDLGAIMIIALFYTGALNVTALAAAAVCIVILAVMNARGVDRIPAYLTVAFVLWICMWKSGASATLAGVIAALFVPMKSLDGSRSPLHSLAHTLKLPVLFGIMPIFAFANAGVPLYGLGLGDLVKPVTLGIAAGLFLGKPIGITIATFATVKSGLGRLPEGATWLQVIGVAWIAGIGFTMSLFIGTLAFPGDDMQNQVRLGVMLGSLLSTTAGVLVLNAARSRRAGA